jgi:peptidoglycan/LPS O-acetylase OafA/YrhL
MHSKQGVDAPVSSPGTLSVHSSVRVPELDGVRGLAIVSVLLWHLMVMPHVLSPGGPKPEGMMWLVRLLSLSWAGVDLFFCLSGFLIAGILLDGKGTASFLPRFYLRRFFRIFPLYWAVLASCVAIPFLAARLDPVAPAPVYGVLLQNLWMATRRTFGGEPLGVTWSLAVEEQFYLVFPLLVLLLRRSAVTALLVLACVAAPLARWAVSAPPATNWMAAYVLTICRADALAMGALLAIVARSGLQRTAVLSAARGLLIVSAGGVALLMANGDTIGSPAMNVAGYSVLALAGASLIALVLTNPNGLSARMARARVLRDAGTVSYCLYLVHVPVVMLCRRYLGVSPVPTTWLAALYALLLPAGLTLGIALVSWKYFESPLIRIGHALDARRQPAPRLASS